MKVNRFLLNLFRIKIIHDDKVRCKDFKVGEQYNILKNVQYINDNNKYHQFDVLYCPHNINRKNVLIVYIHGGAYIFGERSTYHKYATYFCDHGFDFASIDYVVNDGNKSNLDLVKDCFSAIKYIKEHLKKLNLDKDKIVILGDSAGGHLALILAEMLCDNKLSNKIVNDSIDFKPICVLVNCPTFDYSELGINEMSKSGNKRMFGLDAFDIEKRKLICPKTNINSLDIPLFCSTCTNDFIKNQSIKLNETMKNRPNIFKYIDLDAKDKKIVHVHNVIYPDFEESKYINNEMIEFINKCLN